MNTLDIIIDNLPFVCVAVFLIVVIYVAATHYGDDK